MGQSVGVDVSDVARIVGEGGGVDAVTPESDRRQLPALTEAQRHLAYQNMGLVGVHLRHRVPTPRKPRRTREYEDLFQEGCIALMRAAARYDGDRDGAFAAFALPRIRGAIHLALREKFCVVQTPVRGGKPAEVEALGPEPVRHGALLIFGGASPIGESGSDDETAGRDAIRHAIHRRFQRAVGTAMEDLRKRSWRRRNPCAIMARIAEERLLIGSEEGRTPLRRIAREAGVSAGRVSAYEKQLVDAVSEHFCADPQLPLLVKFAGEDQAGFDGRIDDTRAALLARAELDAFARRFEGMDRGERAGVVYALLERSTYALGEVARNLYRLASEDELEAA